MRTLPIPYVHIHGFRRLSGLRLDDCGQVNLVVGGNNSGKTSVLEALLILASPTNVRHWELAYRLRGAWPLVDSGPSSLRRIDGLSWLFPRRNMEIGLVDIQSGGVVRRLEAKAQPIVGVPPQRPTVSSEEYVEGSLYGMRRGRLGQTKLIEESERGLVIELIVNRRSDQADLLSSHESFFRMELWENSRAFQRHKLWNDSEIPISYSTPISHRSETLLASRVSQLLRTNKKSLALDLIQKLDRNVVDLVILAEDDSGLSGRHSGYPDSFALYVEYVGMGHVPAHTMGDGLRRALHFAVTLAELDAGGVLIVDEVEVGMHTAVLIDVFGWLCTACRIAGVQLFVTTHSLEAVDGMLHGASDENLVLYRLEPNEVRRFSGRTLRLARQRFGQEVR